MDADESDVRTTEFDLRIPESATEEEAAAIVAAIEAYLAAERATAAEAVDEQSWAGRRWSFADRLAKLTGRPARVPDGAPADGWSAIGRSDRF